MDLGALPERLGAAPCVPGLPLPPPTECIAIPEAWLSEAEVLRRAHHAKRDLGWRAVLLVREGRRRLASVASLAFDEGARALVIFVAWTRSIATSQLASASLRLWASARLWLAARSACGAHRQLVSFMTRMRPIAGRARVQLTSRMARVRPIAGRARPWDELPTLAVRPDHRRARWQGR